VRRCNEDATHGADHVRSEHWIHRLIDGLARHDRVVLVVAHPDDETIGCGAHLARWADVLTIVHVTDGSPPDDGDAKAAGCASASDYAALRQRELVSAMQIAHVGSEQLIGLGIGDQQAVRSIATIARRLLHIFGDRKPTIVVTQPYEGGHPDHDATALAVRIALHAAESSGVNPRLAECTAYHADGTGALVTGRFLAATTPARTVTLDHDARMRRAAMLACFTSQQRTLVPFGIDREGFRVAPQYDFTSPPHAGRLYYEQFQWGVRDGAQWRTLASSELSAFTANAPHPSDPPQWSNTL